VSIRDEWIVFDTNIWIFGLRKTPGLPACAQLLDQLPRLHIVLPRQVLQELQANFSDSELRSFFRLLSRYPETLKIDWQRPKPEIIAKYQDLGCKLGDGVIAAHLEELGVSVLVSENRDFLEEISSLPFRRLSAAQAIAEIRRTVT
jgi:predicted nucleic acid-binding protein